MGFIHKPLPAALHVMAITGVSLVAHVALRVKDLPDTHALVVLAIELGAFLGASAKWCALHVKTARHLRCLLLVLVVGFRHWA